jgi:hypothetical protein
MGNMLTQRTRPAEVLAELEASAWDTRTAIVPSAELAQLRDVGQFDWQRRIRVPTVKNYAAALLDGTFIGPCATICLVQEIGEDGGVVREFLVNGNHTAEAAHQFGGEVLVTIQRVKVPLTDVRESGFTLAEEVARVLYSGFDRALARDREARDRAWAINAVQLIATEFPDNPRSIDQAVKIKLKTDTKLNDLRTKYTSGALRIASLISQFEVEDHAIAYAPPFLAVSLELLRAEPKLEDAEEFIVRVVSGEGSMNEVLDPADPCMRLRNELHGLYGKKQYGKRRHVGQISRYCAQAWNLFHAGSGEMTRGFSKRYVFRLDGTKWTETGRPDPLVSQAEVSTVERLKTVKNDDLVVPNPKVAA